ncbi:MAG: hypothetical protein D6769_01860 [Methanobacteriota archaeon]|nr:MAG: hypothetical protein D6769_01860 [Euryarchaeota archaeon]
MRVLQNPLLEVKGYYAFLEGEPLPNYTYTIDEFKELYEEPVKSKRAIFSYNKVVMKDGYEYGLLIIPPASGTELNRFSCHKGSKGERAMHLWGASSIQCFDFLNNGGVELKVGMPKQWENYNIEGNVSIYNHDYTSSVWLLKTRPPLRNTEVFIEHKGEPTIYKRNEKKRNYNYLVWKQKDIEPLRENLLSELATILEKRS